MKLLKTHLTGLVLILGFSQTNAQFLQDEYKLLIPLKDTSFKKAIIYHTPNADYYFDFNDFIKDPDIRFKNRIAKKIGKKDCLIINKYMQKKVIFNFGIIMFIVKKIDSGIIIIKKNGEQLSSLKVFITEKQLNQYSWWSIRSYRTIQNKELFNYGSSQSSKNKL